MRNGKLGWMVIALPTSLVPLLISSIVLPSGGQTSSPPKTPAFEQAVWPFFAKNCISCHNAQTKAGALDLQSLRGADTITRSRDTWESIVRKVRNGEMPPPGMPKPDAAQIKATTQQIESEFERVDRLNAANPGRVTARRLNRAEYNNTIRDLLGVNTDPAEDFPQEDSGYGFDMTRHFASTIASLRSHTSKYS